jgi:hypothetical protein
MTIFKRLIWIIVALLPFGVWFLLYKAYNSEYDDNITFFIQSVLLSFLTVALWFFLRVKDQQHIKKLKWLNPFVILFGSPLTFVFAWAYVYFFSLSFEWTQDISKKEEKYSLSKYQNFFKTRYVYYDALTNADTLLIMVTRNNNVLSIKTIKDGHEIDTDIENLPNKEKLSKLGLFKYDKP